MPSWANHFRIADKLLKNIKNLNLEYFIIGNIAPDCGIPTGNNGEYSPPSSVTHFTANDISLKNDCNYNCIYNNYIKNETDLNKKSFYTGYFAHLFTDCEYVTEIYFKIADEHRKLFENQKLWKKVRKEQYNIDSSYFINNGSQSFELFKSYGCFNESYPEWYQNNEISIQMKNIINFLENSEELDIKYKYIVPREIELFTDNTVDKLLKEFQIRNIIL